MSVDKRLPLHPTVNESNFRYLLAKAVRLNHALDVGVTSQRQQREEITGRHRGVNASRGGSSAGEMLAGKPVNHTTSLYFTAPREVTVREEPLPKLQKTQVFVETLFFAISPLTECLIYRGEFPEGMAVDPSIADLSGEFAYPFRHGYAAV